MRVLNAHVVRLSIHKKSLPVLWVVKIICWFNEHIQVKMLGLALSSLKMTLQAYMYKVKSVLALYRRCVLCNYKLQSLKGKWLECVPPPYVSDNCDGTTCPQGRNVISILTWLVKVVCRKWDVCRHLFCWCSKWADICQRHLLSMSYECVCSCDEATSSVLFGNTVVCCQNGPMYFLERGYPKKKCKFKINYMCYESFYAPNVPC